MERIYLTVSSSQQTFSGQKKLSPVVVLKSKYTVKGTSPKYVKLSWNEIILHY